MSTFSYHDSRLFCEQVPLAELAAQAGTPLYVYSAARIRENVARLQAAFQNFDLAIHFSLKANANLSIIRLLDSLGLGMDAVSGGEIHHALAAGVAGKNIVFAGVGKTRQELAYALQNDVGWFNVESEFELKLLNQLAGEMGKKPQVALRLNPEIQAQTHHKIATGHGGAKFGMDSARVSRLLSQKYSHLHIEALHVHIGSQLGSVAETVEAVARAQELLTPYPQIKTLNIGGGFPVDYTGDSQYPAWEDFARALEADLSGWRVKIEPGRAVMADAGLLLTQVLYTKKQGASHFAVVDASMTELLRPALYDAVHPILPLLAGDKNAFYTVVGPVCESSDILHQGLELPELQADDLLAILFTGAYGMTMASNYNQRPRPAEVLVTGDKWEVIRRRETWDDLLSIYG